MAQLKKIVRSNPLSAFQQVAPDGGATFRLLAEVMSTANERVEAAAIDQMEREGAEHGRKLAGQNRVSTGGTSEFNGDAVSLIKEFEGFRETPYWDVNAHRVGFGSDTITDAQGNVRKVKEGDRVSAEDADRDLNRRLSTEFIPIARNAIGADRFDGMSTSQQAVLSSIAYNYGEIPDRIVGALRNGSDDEIAAAIRGLENDNGGINKKRRNREADIFLSGPSRMTGRETPGVVVQNADGKLERRRFSPFAGPILQAHDAAARVAEQAELINRGQIDLLEMSSQYEMDPTGFANAAKGYIEQITENASPDIREDLRSVLGQQVRRRAFGIEEARQKDVRARAANESKALIDRWQDELAEALVTGDEAAISSARNQLNNLLQARETLPGLAWTRAQSENVIIEAGKAAEKLRAKQNKALSDEYKSDFQLITDSAKAGRQAENEDILSNPDAVAMHPELAREAAAFVALRDSSPDFLQLTPQQQAAEIARLAAEPVSEEWQIDVVESASELAKENAKAWDEDPVKRASEVLENPPPALPDLTPEDPSKFVDALAARREYMNAVVTEGFTDTKAYLSEEEANQISVLMGKGTDPAIRAAMSAAIVAGFGPDAVRVFDEIGGDRVTMFAGKMQALGGRPDVAAAILQGQQMLAENLVQIPKNADRIEAFDSQMAGAFQGVPGALQAQAELMEAAKALYASQAQGIDPSSDAAADLMAQSIQTVLGQTKNKRGDTTGGIQPVMGHQTLLPIGVTGESVDTALRMALGGSAPSEKGLFNRASSLITGAGMALMGAEQPARPDVWGEIGVSGGPMFNGKPIPRAYIDNDLIRMVSTGGNMVRLEINNGTSRYDVEDGDGNVLIFDLTKFLEAAG